MGNTNTRSHGEAPRPQPLLEQYAERGWIPDSWRHECICCHRSFSTVRRRHHCRYCGDLVCARCSRQRIAPRTARTLPGGAELRAGVPSLPQVSGSADLTSVRSCDTCYALLQGDTPPEGGGAAAGAAEGGGALDIGAGFETLLHEMSLLDALSGLQGDELLSGHEPRSAVAVHASEARQRAAFVALMMLLERRALLEEPPEPRRQGASKLAIGACPVNVVDVDWLAEAVRARGRAGQDAGQGSAETGAAEDGWAGADVAVEDKPECALCLEQFVVGQRVRTLPCGHHFHCSIALPPPHALPPSIVVVASGGGGDSDDGQRELLLVTEYSQIGCVVVQVHFRSALVIL